MSADRLWQACRRAFYYQYVAPRQMDLDAEDRNRLFVLRRLTGLKMLEGRLVHETAENLINQHRLGRSLHLEPAVAFFEERVRNYEEAADQEIAETYNGLRINEGFFDWIRRDGARQVANFVNIVWPTLARLEYLQHEEYESFYLQNIRVNVKVDYTTRSKDGKIVVTDWKTGREVRPDDGNVQLAVYGLWASSKYEVPLKQVRVEVAYLRTGRSFPLALGEDLVRNAREAVMAGAAEVLAAETLEDFPTDPEPEKCTSCKFASICPDGREILEQFYAEAVRDVVDKPG